MTALIAFVIGACLAWYMATTQLRDERKSIAAEREWHKESLVHAASDNAILLDKLLEAKTRERGWRDAWKNVKDINELPQELTGLARQGWLWQEGKIK